MPIETVPPNDRVERFVASGGQTVFPFDFPIYEAAHLAVLRDRAGVQTELVLGVDYTLTGVEQQAGGVVTLTSPALAGDIISLQGRQPIAKTTLFQTGGELRAKALNDEFNKLVIGLQQVQLVRDLTLRVAATDPVPLPLPPASQRAGRFLSFDGNGHPIAAVGTPGSTPISAWAATLLDDTSAAQARATLGATTVGGQLFTAPSAADARATLGGTTVGIQVFTAPSAADARAAISAPPIPTTASGPGQWLHIATAPGGTWTLPAGGTWAYHVRGFTTGGVSNLQFISGVAAGGTAIINSPNIVFEGLAWRLA
ncbi:MAG: hypothetical protein N3D18_04250 [Roseococcus sp.]|nr:hypothetical protein [Roseococcus sp.]